MTSCAPLNILSSIIHTHIKEINVRNRMLSIPVAVVITFILCAIGPLIAQSSSISSPSDRHAKALAAQPGAIVFDFEADDGEFITSVPSDWQWGAPAIGPASAFSGNNVWGTVLDANYSDFALSWLETPPLDLSGYQHAALTFWHWYHNEFSSGALWDGGNVKISVDGGPFEILYPKGGYDGFIDPYNTFLGLQPAFGGAAHNGNYWHQEFFDLTPFANRTVVIRFEFGSDSNTNEPGWYIDDVQIVYNPTNAPLITHTTRLPDTYDTIGPYEVSAKIVDNSSVDSAFIMYRTDAGVPFSEVPMAETGDEYFEGGIPGQPYDTIIDYYVMAVDDSGNIATDPPVIPDAFYSFFTTDRAPEIVVEPEEITLSLAPGEFIGDSLIMRNDGLLDLHFVIEDSVMTGVQADKMVLRPERNLFSVPLENIKMVETREKMARKIHDRDRAGSLHKSTDLPQIIADLPNDLIPFDPTVTPADNPDIIAVYAENDGQNLTFEIEFAADIVPSRYYTLFSFDLDQNINTGFYPSKLGHAVGVEFELMWDTGNYIGSAVGLTAAHALLMDWDLANVFYAAPIAFDGAKMTATVPLEFLNNDDGNMNFGVVAVPTLENPLYGDVAPEGAYAVLGYESGAPWILEFPMEGTIPGDESAVLYYAINGGLLLPGEYRAAIIISSNDPVTPIKQVPLNITVGTTNVDDAVFDTALPTSFDLHQNYPNPFSAGGGSAYGGNRSTTIAFQLPHSAHMTLKVYNMLGQEIRTLVNGKKTAGSYTVSWNGIDDNANKAPSGIYIVRLDTGGFTKTIKMVLMQ